MAKKLLSVSKLLGYFWDVFKARWWTLLVIYLVPVVFYLLVFSVLAASGFNTFFQSGNLDFNINELIPFIIGAVLFFLFFLTISIWSGIALILAVKNWEKGTKCRDCYRLAWPLIGKYFIVGLLFAAIYLGSAIFFVIPGIIWGVWLSLSFFVVVVEHKRGLAVLRRSKFLVSGYWWALVGRWLFLLVIFLLINVFFSLVTPVLKDFFDQLRLGGAFTFLGSALSMVISFTSSMFLLIYSYAMYENLVKIKGKGIAKRKWPFVFFGVIGSILLLIMVVALPIALIAINPAEQLKKAKDFQVKQELTDIYGVLEQYRLENGDYPANLKHLEPDYLPTGSIKTNLEYKIFMNGTFSLCGFLEGEQKNYCLPDDFLEGLQQNQGIAPEV